MLGHQFSFFQIASGNRCRAFGWRIFQLDMGPAQRFAKSLGGIQHGVFHFVGCLRLLPACRYAALQHNRVGAILFGGV